MGTRPTPYQIPHFGGLRLDKEVEECGPGEAIDLLNVDLDGGALRTRDGSTALATVSNVSGIASWASPPTSGPHTIICDSTNNLKAYDYAGTLLATSAAGNEYWQGASLGTAAAGPYFYMSSKGGAAGMRRWDGTNFSTPAGMPDARFVAVQSPDNRLVTAYNSTQKSRVKFSDAGAPETWTAANFVDLYPNDGEIITAMVAWRDLLFVFKESRFFVFYGNSTDSAGNPVFNFRIVDTGVGTAQAGLAYQAACATDSGVYFIHRSGVYRTTGGPPVRIRTFDFLYNGQSRPFFNNSSGAAISATPGTITPLGSRIVLTAAGGASGAGEIVLVFDPDTDTMLRWSLVSTTLQTRGLAPFQQAGVAPSLVYASTSKLLRLDSTKTTDDGTAIVSRYRSGFYSPIGSPSQECTIRESILEGIGSPSFSVSRDFGAVPTTAGGAKTAVTLGTSPAYAQGRHRVSQRGRRFSWQAEATSGAWRINSITQHVTSIRSPGLKTT